MARVALEREVNRSGRTPRPRRGLTQQQQRKRLDQALFQARHPYGAVAIGGVLYLAILAGAVAELIHGSYLGVTWVLYGVAGFAVAAGLTALAALAGRRGWRARRWIGPGAAITGAMSLYSLKFAFPHQPYDGVVAVLGVDLHAALLGYALVAATVPAVMIARTVPRARAWKLLGPAGQARQGGLPARVRFLHWKKSRTWHYGSIGIADGEISWHAADGSRTLPFTSACQSLAAQPPGARSRRRATLIRYNDGRILVDVPRKVLAALARDLDQYPQSLPDRQDPA
jgi:hypothetical protein